MDKVSHCPVCGELWHTLPIPPEYHENHSPPYYYSTVIAMSSWETDKIHSWHCPDCGSIFNLDGSIRIANAPTP